MPPIWIAHGYQVGAELGVAAAGHVEEILKHPEITRLFGVDSYQHRDDYDDAMNMPQERFEELYGYVLRFTAQYGNRFKLIRKSTLDASYEIADGSLDFVYVDADHSYAACKADLATWLPKLRRGGMMSGHDFNFPGVLHAVQEVATDLHLEAESNWWFIPLEAKQ